VQLPVKAFDVFKLKHVPFYKGLSDLLIGPGNEHFVVIVSLLGQPHAEEDGHT
jgi:hypothetical protein